MRHTETFISDISMSLLRHAGMIFHLTIIQLPRYIFSLVMLMTAILRSIISVFFLSPRWAASACRSSASGSSSYTPIAHRPRQPVHKAAAPMYGLADVAPCFTAGAMNRRITYKDEASEPRRRAMPSAELRRS